MVLFNFFHEDFQMGPQINSILKKKKHIVNMQSEFLSYGAIYMSSIAEASHHDFQAPQNAKKSILYGETQGTAVWYEF